MTTRVFCGTFEAEAYWREPNLAVLPSVRDPNALRVVAAMDEMLFALCAPGDTVVTASAMNGAHLDYLHSLGFDFKQASVDANTSNIDDESYDSIAAPNIFRLLNTGIAHARLKERIPVGAALEPFAVLPGTTETAERYDLSVEFADLGTVRAVNTKCYSIKMRERLDLANVGTIVADVDALLREGASLLKTGPLLIKDDYGVSGKGNQLISTEPMLQRIGRYLSRQEVQGKAVRFVLEPYLDKVTDCSCQFRLSKEGDMQFFGVQELVNDGLSFGVSRSPGAAMMRQLQEGGYFWVMEQLARKLRDDGYYGDVCVDSMILRNGSLVPIVEINARRSMSLIKFALDCFFAERQLAGQLASVSTLFVKNHSTEEILRCLNLKQVLFTLERGEGVVPLTASAMLPSAQRGDVPVRGRLYAYLIAENDQRRAELLDALRRALNVGVNNLQSADRN